MPFLYAGREWSVKTMSLGSMQLRLESGDGSPAKEYRIEDGDVEVRTLDPEGGSVRRTGSVWWRLTPGQLSIHVERSAGDVCCRHVWANRVCGKLPKTRTIQLSELITLTTSTSL
jgi:hypothetical protein